MAIFNFFSKTVGIDPGSQHLRLAHQQQVILNEPAALSLDHKTRDVLGFGNDTVHIHDGLVIHPIDKVIGDFHAFEYLLRLALRRGLHEPKWKPITYRMFMAIPLRTTEVAKRAYRDAAEHAGANRLTLVYQPTCAALGLNLLQEKRDFILVDWGASSVMITVFVDAAPISYGEVHEGTWALREALATHLRQHYQITLTRAEAEAMLCQLPGPGEVFEVKGQKVDTATLYGAFDAILAEIMDKIQLSIEQASTHPSINQILANGLYFTGGGALLSGMIERLNLPSQLKYTVSQNPLLDCIHGLMQVMEAPKEFEEYLMV